MTLTNSLPRQNWSIIFAKKKKKKKKKNEFTNFREKLED